VCLVRMRRWRGHGASQARAPLCAPPREGSAAWLTIRCRFRWRMVNLRPDTERRDAHIVPFRRPSTSSTSSTATPSTTRQPERMRGPGPEQWSMSSWLSHPPPPITTSCSTCPAPSSWWRTTLAPGPGNGCPRVGRHRLENTAKRVGPQADPCPFARAQMSHACDRTTGSWRHCRPSPQVSPAAVAATTISASA